MPVLDEPDITRPKLTPLRGLIQPRSVTMPFELARWEPLPALDPFIEQLWRVRWSLAPGDAFVQFTLPKPVVNVVFEAGAGNVHGLVPGRFRRELVGHGEVLGFMFRPAAFAVLHPGPMSELVDQRIPVGEMFGPEATALAASLTALSEPARVARASAWLASLLPERLPDALAEMSRLVDRIREDRSITRVAPLAAELGVSERTLQRRFTAAVGWSPRQVIRRRRVHDALARLDADPVPDLAQLALELGYCDQAHFSRDFKAVTGMTARAYLAS